MFTLAAIVLTANHYWLDAVVAVFLFGIALVVDFGIDAGAPVVGEPRREPLSRPGSGRRSPHRFSDARSPSGMAADSCVPGVTDT